MYLINVDNRSYLHRTSPKVSLLLYGNRDGAKQCIIDHCLEYIYTYIKGKEIV